MFDINFLGNEKALVVKINEELDHHSCEKIRNRVDMAVDFGKANKIIFDFAGVNFMDSSGIGMVMGRYKNIHKNGGIMVVTGLKPTVKKIFQMSGLFKILTEYKTTEEALSNLKELKA